MIEQIAQEREAPLTLVGRDWQWRFIGLEQSATGDLCQKMVIYRTGHDASPEYPLISLPLLGTPQLENATTAVATLIILRERGMTVPDEAIVKGLEQVRWPGRMETLGHDPLVVVDGAHNVDSTQRLLQSIRSYFTFNRLIVVFGAGHTHIPQEMLSLLLPAVDMMCVTQAHHPKAMPAEELERTAHDMGYSVARCDPVDEALDWALEQAAPDDLVLVTGSLFVVAEAREAWADLHDLPMLPSDPPGIY